MSNYVTLSRGQSLFGLEFVKAGALALENFIATGFGSRGGPNKVSNKLKRCPVSYLANAAPTPEYFLATGLRSRGGPNKVSNKLRARPSAYYLFN